MLSIGCKFGGINSKNVLIWLPPHSVTSSKVKLKLLFWFSDVPKRIFDSEIVLLLTPIPPPTPPARAGVEMPRRVGYASISHTQSAGVGAACFLPLVKSALLHYRTLT